MPLILEAPTGEGKTEVALLAAEILGSSGAPAGGPLLAAPTMSTSDSLFARTRDWAGRTAGTKPLPSRSTRRRSQPSSSPPRPMPQPSRP